jgi:signal transduction histidine kinase
VTGQHRIHPARPGETDPGDASARAEALLHAAKEFLRSDDLPARELLASVVAERTIQLREAIGELHSASEAKADLLANVSHELRTPLTAILGFSEMLVSGQDGPLNPLQQEDATTILENSRRLLELIDDLIDISRIESSRLELEIRPVSINLLLTAVVEELRALAGAKSISLTFQDAVEDVVVDGDEVRLHEVFVNLISNAVKFTRPGGTVKVAAILQHSPDLPARQVRIDVIDNGIGIPADEYERIFEKFHQIAGLEYPGTGLGLAISRQLVARHGGSLTVESTVGLGSRFSVVLPLVPAALVVG